MDEAEAVEVEERGQEEAEREDEEHEHEHEHEEVSHLPERPVVPRAVIPVMSDGSVDCAGRESSLLVPFVRVVL